MISALLGFSLSNSPATLAVGGLLIGNLAGGKWSQVSDDLPEWRNLEFHEVKLGKLGEPLVIEEPVLEGMSVMPVIGLPEGRHSAAFFSGPAPTFPRPITMPKTIPNELRLQVMRFLKGQKMKTKSVVWSTYISGDFDGDKRVDALIKAQSWKTPGDTGIGEWSRVFLLQGGKSLRVIGWQDGNEEQLKPDVELVALADFDRDGTYEAATLIWYLEGRAASLIHLGRNGPKVLVEKSS